MSDSGLWKSPGVDLQAQRLEFVAVSVQQADGWKSVSLLQVFPLSPCEAALLITEATFSPRWMCLFCAGSLKAPAGPLRQVTWCLVTVMPQQQVYLL